MGAISMNLPAIYLPPGRCSPATGATPRSARPDSWKYQPSRAGTSGKDWQDQDSIARSRHMHDHGRLT
jgi:hypothetical protein